MARRIDVVRIAAGASRGTGFFIDDEHVLTALHVVGRVAAGKLVLHDPELLLTAACADGASLRFPVCVSSADDVSDFDERLDWACIKVNGAFSGIAAPPLGEMDASDQSAAWDTYGFPDGRDEDGKATAGTIASITATLTLRGEKLSAIQLFSREAAAGAGGVVRGYSGAPVLVQGRAVAILCAAAVDDRTGRSDEGTLYAIPLSALAERLPLPSPRCPYPGLRAFDESESSSFFGRSQEVDELARRLLAGERQVLVVGPSGSGKSSLVRAGVLPRLRAAEKRWTPVTTHPGSTPSRNVLDAVGGDGDIAARIALRAGSAERVLVFIDQLEELFTLAPPAEQATFFDTYEALRRVERCTIVTTLRVDFFGALLESDLWPLMKEQTYQLTLAPLRGKLLAEAIESPARAVGVRFEPALRDRLVSDAASEPGALPMLQMVLREELWDRLPRSRRSLRLADYEALGELEKSGLAAAFERRADSVLHGLDADRQGVARRIFLRLVSFGEGRPSTRRQQTVLALRDAFEEKAVFDAVLRAFVDGRLLTMDTRGAGAEVEEVVDLAHEALITAWSTLRGWIETRRTAEKERRWLEAKVDEWEMLGRGDAALLDPVELAQAERWTATAEARDVGVSQRLRGLLGASRDAIRKAERERRRRLWISVGALGLFAAVVSGLAIAASRSAAEAIHQRAEAEKEARLVRQREAAAYMEQGRQLLVGGHPMQALPYLVAAREEIDSPQLATLLAGTGEMPILNLADVNAVAFSPDSKRLVTVGSDGTARVRDAATGVQVGPSLRHNGRVHSAGFSPDSARVVTAGDDGGCVWDAATGELMVGPLQHPVLDHAGAFGRVSSAAFSPDGKRVLTGSSVTVRIWDASTGELRATLLPHERPLLKSAAFSPDSTQVVTLSEDETARVWNAASGKLLAAFKHEQPINSAAFSPDSKHVITASVDNTAPIWVAATGKRLAPQIEQSGGVNSAAFSPDGKRVVTAGQDGNALFFDAATGVLVAPAMRHETDPRSAAFSRDGTRVLTVSDKTANLWDPAMGGRLGPPLEDPRVVTSAALSPDGTRVVTVSAGHVARVWGAATAKPLPALLHAKTVYFAAFSPDGTRVVTIDDGAMRFWDAATGKPLEMPFGYAGMVRCAAFSRDGTRVVTGSRDGIARLWDANGNPLKTLFGHRGQVNSAMFSTDGKSVVTASEDGTARIWNTSTGESLTLQIDHGVSSAAFSHDDARVITVTADGTASIWSALTGKPHEWRLEQALSVTSAAFSPDDTRVVTTSKDGTARIWDAVTGRLLAPPLEHGYPVTSAAFSPDGTHLVTATGMQARIWDALTGKQLAPPLQHDSSVISAAFSPDGAHLLTATEFEALDADNTVRIWILPRSTRTLSEWKEELECAPFVLANGVITENTGQPPRCWPK